MGFSYFSQLDNVSKARCVLFWGRGDDWEGILGPHWLAALRCSRAPAALRALLIWRVNVEGATERGPAVSEKRRSLFQEESGVYRLPGWENLLWTKEDNTQGSLLRQWFKRKKKRERERRVSPSVQGWVATSCCCCCCCLCCCSCRCRGCHQVRLPCVIGIASCVIASGYTHRNPYMFNKVLPSVVRSGTRLHSDLPSELGTSAWFCFGKLL